MSTNVNNDVDMNHPVVSPAMDRLRQYYLVKCYPRHAIIIKSTTV